MTKPTDKPTSPKPKSVNDPISTLPLEVQGRLLYLGSEIDRINGIQGRLKKRKKPLADELGKLFTVHRLPDSISTNEWTVSTSDRVTITIHRHLLIDAGVSEEQIEAATTVDVVPVRSVRHKGKREEDEDDDE